MMPTDQRTNELRDAVIEAARTFTTRTPSGAEWRSYVQADDYQRMHGAILALDDHLAPDPLRDAVGLLRRALPALKDDAWREHDAIDAFLATQDGAS